MFKIQNFFVYSRRILSKLQLHRPLIPTSKYQLSLLSSFTRSFISLPPISLVGMTLLSIQPLDSVNQTLTNSINAEKDNVKELITNIIEEMKEQDLDKARNHIDEAIQMAERNQFVEFLPQLYGFLVLITLREGRNDVAEEILVRSIEKLTEIGFKEADNEIVRLQLILARLYQMKGDSEMAGLGFRNCINIQEVKINADPVMDEDTSSLYLSTLFWYGIFLSDQDDLIDSKTFMEKALRVSQTTSNDPARTIVILHNLAELSFRLKVSLHHTSSYERQF